MASQPIHSVRQLPPFRVPPSTVLITADVVTEQPPVLILSPVLQRKAFQAVAKTLLVTPDPAEQPAIFAISPVAQKKVFQSVPQYIVVTPDPVTDQPAIFALVAARQRFFQSRPFTTVVTPDATPDVPTIFPLIVKQGPGFRTQPKVVFVEPFVLPPQFPAITVFPVKGYKAFQSKAGVIIITFPDPTPPEPPTEPIVEYRTHYQRGRLSLIRVER